MKRRRNPGILFNLIPLLTLVLIFQAPILTYGGDLKPIKPSQKDKCPVCGMFVAKYPDFLAEILFKDGSYAFFDGTKDMFRYYFNLAKYNPARQLLDIDSLYVTHYYTLDLIDGQKAYYVTGSDVFGPMGRELIPFEQEKEAREFMKDHKGKSLLKFHEVTQETIKSLD